MEIQNVANIMGMVEKFCQGEVRALIIANYLDELYETILTLFTLTGVCDVNGEVLEGVEPWRVLGTINLMYMLRTNRRLGGIVGNRRFKKR